MNLRKIQPEREYFLFLLPVFFLFHGFTQNYPLIPVAGSLVLLIKYLVATAIFTWLFFLFIRSRRSAGMLAFLVMSFHFFFGAIHDSLKSWLSNSFFTKYVFIVPFCFVLFVVIFFYLKKKIPAFKNLARYLNLLFLALIVIDLVQLTIAAANYKDDFGKELTAELTACDSCSKPDIFLIIADEYAGTQELADIFHFDNSPFENQLRQRGFHIVDSSQSNYNYTPFSMASMLSMGFLNGLEGKNKSLNDRNLCYRTINRNSLVAYLKENGYAIKNCSIFRFADKLPYASTSFYKTGIDLVTAQTFLSRLDRDIRYNMVTRFNIESEKEKTLKDELRINEALYQHAWDEASSSSDKPRFVYTHLEMPHYPYYFDSNGKPNKLTDLYDIEQADQKKYIGYLQYANKKYLELIDHILEVTKGKAIVMFMSDHGFREFLNDTADHKYHFMNFNSIYVPGKNYDGFYKGMSNVNQFRILLNKQFGQRLPLLKDSTSFLKEE
jgi:hypothetical protein